MGAQQKSKKLIEVKLSSLLHLCSNNFCLCDSYSLSFMVDVTYVLLFPLHSFRKFFLYSFNYYCPFNTEKIMFFPISATNFVPRLAQYAHVHTKENFDV